MDVCCDVLGRIAGGAKVRALVDVTEPPEARLHLLTKSKSDPGSVDVETRGLVGFRRSGPGHSARWVFDVGDETEITVIPAGCSCGAGVLASANPFQGDRRRVPVPDWLTA